MIIEGMPTIVLYIGFLLAVLAGVGLVGMYLFTHFLKGYNNAAGYSDD
ncbi:hypothetical protein HZS55_14960 [Halosimplex rubrum]|uniref:Uncharacterized protein n=1 Tax=Halosimplex rubrum TaxID=869889 RepID=A0A7D5T6Q7_9EURY|nr:hypothetical protein [Halosimplex rubrum]QLH78509.1 hypothetical protein HZS55_14960 [Halosimplex rubrum]